jgi:hypothetical protein
MSELLIIAATGSFALAGLGLTLLAGLRGWQGWLDLKRLELGAGQAGAARETGGMAELIEMADLKERIRKLESIAACVDL